MSKHCGIPTRSAFFNPDPQCVSCFSLVTLFRTSSPPVIPLLPSLIEFLSILEPSSILDLRVLFQGGVPIPQVLVAWKHIGVEDATWEDADTLAASYRQQDLEDKVLIE